VGDLKNPRAIYAKGILFLVLGGLAGGLILVDNPKWSTAGLLAICVWAFCRSYYFAFYVIEHYVDAQYRFAGILHFLRYCWHRTAGQKEHKHGPH
jgi:hypothetical protein